jgi:uroporphyrinogen-III synthase
MSEARAKTVLITRPEDSAQDTASIITSMGFEPIIAPVMEIKPVAHDGIVPGRYNAIVVSSAHGIHNFKPAAMGFDVPVFCVGGRTEAALRDAGYKNIVTEQRMAALIPLIESRTSQGGWRDILYIRGQDVRHDLESEQRLQHLNVTMCITYAAEAVLEFSPRTVQAFKEDGIDIVLLYSVRAAEIFLRLCKRQQLIEKLSHIKVLCLSEAVVKCMDSKVWQKTYVPETPSQSAMMEVLQKI